MKAAASRSACNAPWLDLADISTGEPAWSQDALGALTERLGEWPDRAENAHPPGTPGTLAQARARGAQLTQNAGLAGRVARSRDFFSDLRKHGAGRTRPAPRSRGLCAGRPAHHLRFSP